MQNQFQKIMRNSVPEPAGERVYRGEGERKGGLGMVIRGVERVGVDLFAKSVR